MRVIAVSGSLRTGSFNSAALRVAAERAPEGVDVEVRGLAGIPPYDEDLRARGVPEPVTTLAADILAADAVLVATPEYNYSIPGVLKNAVDWLSRMDPQPFAGKPMAILGASAGRLGTARAQYHLRQVCVFLDAHVLNKPEVMIGGAGSVFGDGGELLDEATGKRIAAQLDALAAWARRLRG